ncbi:MAG: hypothetical protein GY757_62515 [bacterium]|nr:hypothetical protein [bacterium]
MKNKKKKEFGFSMMEALIAVGIMGFVIMSILTGFSQQKIQTQKNYTRSIAVSLSEAKMDELLNYTATELNTKISSGEIINPGVDYIVLSKDDISIEDSDPSTEFAEMRRTTTLTQNGTFLEIEVIVEYGRVKGEDSYPFMVYLNSMQRG